MFIGGATLCRPAAVRLLPYFYITVLGRFFCGRRMHLDYTVCMKKSKMEDCKFLLLGLLVVLSTLIHLCHGQHGHIQHGGLSREYLLALNFLNSIDFPPELTQNNTRRERKRGRRGGV